MPIAPNIPPDTLIGTNDSTTITVPTVVAPQRPDVEGEDILDRGDAAEFEIVHALVGPCRQRARVIASDLGENIDIDRLIRLGAIVAIEKAPSKSKK